jgi:hypothetical protein
LALSLLFGCEAPTLSSAAAPLTTYDGPGAPLVWGLPGDAACSFPTAADTAKIDAAVVTFRVLVGPDGSPQAVQTLEEPGFGFGSAATRCAMARKYSPASDEQGVPYAAWTPPIHLRFVR